MFRKNGERVVVTVFNCCASFLYLASILHTETISSKEGKQRLPYDVLHVLKLILLFKKYYFSNILGYY